jgi:hypothetical protein
MNLLERIGDWSQPIYFLGQNPISFTGAVITTSAALAVNPANPLQIAASAFTPDPGGGALAPIYVSTDGGSTWVLNSIVPSDSASGSMTADITVAFSSSNNMLYAGIIRLPILNNSTRLNILSTRDFLSSTKK